MQEYDELQAIGKSRHLRAGVKLQPSSTSTTVRENNGNRGGTRRKAAAKLRFCDHLRRSAGVVGASLCNEFRGTGHRQRVVDFGRPERLLGGRGE
jgi:hypothetical protein